MNTFCRAVALQPKEALAIITKHVGKRYGPIIRTKASVPTYFPRTQAASYQNDIPRAQCCKCFRHCLTNVFITNRLTD
nr:hypothetical protein Q903MT_gene338 [Picea sitchensis]